MDTFRARALAASSVAAADSSLALATGPCPLDHVLLVHNVSAAECAAIIRVAARREVVDLGASQVAAWAICAVIGG